MTAPANRVQHKWGHTRWHSCLGVSPGCSLLHSSRTRCGVAQATWRGHMWVCGCQPQLWSQLTAPSNCHAHEGGSSNWFPLDSRVNRCCDLNMLPTRYLTPEVMLEGDEAIRSDGLCIKRLWKAPFSFHRWRTWWEVSGLQPGSGISPEPNHVRPWSSDLQHPEK